MARNNAFMAKIEAHYDAKLREARFFTIQQCKDILLIAAHKEFGFGQDRIKRLSDAFDTVFQGYADMVLEDAACDKDIWYSKSKIDQQLKEICGENFASWEERYK